MVSGVGEKKAWRYLPDITIAFPYPGLAFSTPCRCLRRCLFPLILPSQPFPSSSGSTNSPSAFFARRQVRRRFIPIQFVDSATITAFARHHYGLCELRKALLVSQPSREALQAWQRLGPNCHSMPVSCREAAGLSAETRSSSFSRSIGGSSVNIHPPVSSPFHLTPLQNNLFYLFCPVAGSATFGDPDPDGSECSLPVRLADSAVDCLKLCYAVLFFQFCIICVHVFVREHTRTRMCV